MSVDQGQVEPQAGTPAPRGELSRRRFLAWNLGPLAVAAVVGCAAALGTAVAGETATAGRTKNACMDPVWDDGQAEAARYEAREQGSATRSGTLRALERTIY
jgi:hypothetical protein